MIDERLRAALAALVATVLHLGLLAWWLPWLTLWPDSPATPSPEGPRPGDLEIDRPFIAVTLPSGPMDLEWSLGSIDAAAPSPRFDRPAGKPLGSDRFSQLGDAAAEAEASGERDADALTALAQAPAEFIAEVSLAGARLRLAPMLGDVTLREPDAPPPRVSDAPTELASAPPPAERARPAATVTPPPRERVRATPRPAARPTTRPSPAVTPAGPEPLATTLPTAAPPVTPPPVVTPRPTRVVPPEPAPPLAPIPDTTPPPPLPDLAPPQPPARATPPPSLMLGEGGRPDRGPGAFTPNSNAFFSRMTAHLFAANQRALAEAIRAGPKLTLVVRFWIDRQGRVLDARVARSSGVAELDRRAEKVLLDASPVPQLAPDMPQETLELSFPVQVYR